MFGSIGMPEMIVIVVIALIIFGPRKLPELGKSLGKSIAEFKRASNELRKHARRGDQDRRADSERKSAEMALPPEDGPRRRPHPRARVACRRGSARGCRRLAGPHGGRSFRDPQKDPTGEPDRWPLDDSESEAAGKMSFLEHLDELRKRLIYSLISLGVGVGIACLFIERIYEFVMRPMQQMLPPGGKLIYTEGPRSVHALHPHRDHRGAGHRGAADHDCSSGCSSRRRCTPRSGASPFRSWCWPASGSSAAPPSRTTSSFR